jgi:hypothetical protein
MRFQYRTVSYRTVPGRYGIEKKRSRAGRDGTVSISRGTRRYAVSDSYTALPCRRKKSFNPLSPGDVYIRPGIWPVNYKT